jgi:hypothetical protein
MTIATLAIRLNDFPCVVTSTSEIHSTYATDFMGGNPASASLEDIVSKRLDKYILAAERSIGSRSNPGNIGGEMMPAPYTLPLRVRKSGESFPVGKRTASRSPMFISRKIRADAGSSIGSLASTRAVAQTIAGFVGGL